MIVLEPKKLNRKMWVFLHDHRNARKMQTSTLGHQSKRKMPRKTSSSRNWKFQNNTTLIQLANQISLPLKQFISITPPVILKSQKKNSARVQSNAFMLLAKPYSRNFKKNIAIQNPNSSSWQGRLVHKPLPLCRCFHDWCFFGKHQLWIFFTIQKFSEAVFNAANYLS